MYNQFLIEALAKAFRKAFPVTNQQDPAEHYRHRVTHEYSAQSAHVSIEEDVKALTEDLGYRLLLQMPDVAYLVHHEETFKKEEQNYVIGCGQHRIAILPPKLAEHESWCTSTKNDFDLLHEAIYRSLEFLAGTEEVDAENMYTLFNHRETGQLIQIAWRQQPIFPKLFSRARAPMHA